MFDKSLHLIPHNNEAISFFNYTHNHSNPEFTFNQKGIAFITDSSDFSTNLRKCIEKFKNHFKNISIYDAGLTDDCSFKDISTLIQHLNQKQIIPFIIGNHVDYTGDIAAHLDSNLYHISNSINNITGNAQYVKNNYIAYQRHLCDLDDVLEIESVHFNSISLGKIRSYPYLPEPVLRDCQMLHIHLSAIRSSECPGLTDTLPTGLNIEELCQLMKYAGTANNLKSIFIHSGDIPADNPEAANIIAESLWYFAEGMNLQQNFDHPYKNPDYSQFIVSNASDADDLIFIKNNRTHRWWVNKSNNDQHEYLACAFEEYEYALSNGEASDRISKFLSE